MDAVFLSRLQFAITTMFPILFPVLTIGLAVYLVAVEGLWLATTREIYYRMYRFWVRIFAIHFAVGVVSGVVLEFEFGTHFAVFSQAVAGVFAPLMAYEGMTAFFLEAGFLGIMLFGWNRVPRGVHCVATSLVAVRSQGLTLGGILSGIRVADGRFAGGAMDWLNPFSVMVGIALMPGYALLAATYLILKTTSPIRKRAYG